MHLTVSGDMKQNIDQVINEWFFAANNIIECVGKDGKRMVVAYVE